MASSRHIACIESSLSGMPQDGVRVRRISTATGARYLMKNTRRLEFERVVALRARTEAIARHLSDFLKKTDRFAKTIVFCVDQEHAGEMRRALGNLNSDS